MRVKDELDIVKTMKGSSAESSTTSTAAGSVCRLGRLWSTVGNGIWKWGERKLWEREGGSEFVPEKLEVTERRDWKSRITDIGVRHQSTSELIGVVLLRLGGGKKR